MKPSHYLGLVLLTQIICISTATATDIYVSPSGNDASFGTIDHPVATLTRAQSLERAAIKRDEPVTVILEGGTYYLPTTLLFTVEDSGAQKLPVLWRAADGQTPIISGGIKLNLQWQPYKNHILQSAAPANLQTDQLFLNGQRQILARYPNYDPHVAIFNGYAPDAISPARIARWSDPTGAFFHAMHPALWNDLTYVITGKDAAGNLQMEGGWQSNRASKPSPRYRYVENVFEELDAPGEWFLNTKTHTLFFYPPDGIDLPHAIIEAPLLKRLIDFQGSENSPVQWLTFRGITFRHTLRTFMETREPILRSDWTLYRGGALFFTGTQDCAIEDCDFDQLGGNTIFLSGYNRRVSISRCFIHDSGASGIIFCGQPSAVRSPLFEYHQTQPLAKIDPAPGPATDDYPADCLLDDCLITRIGRFEKQVAGVGIDMAARITIRHCSIYDVPRSGINIGDGCWGGNIIEFCDVFDTVLETGDHGSFNAWGRDRYWLSNVQQIDRVVAANPALPLLDTIEPNIIRNSRWRCDHGWDIDLDDGATNYHIYNNLCLHGGIKNREGFDRTVENNIMVAGSFSCHVWPNNSGDIFRKNIIFQPYKPIHMPAIWGKQIDFNLLHNPGAPSPTPAASLSKLSKQDQHSMDADAQFVDPTHGNYSVKENSPALTLGFTNFPMDQFGVQTPRLKSIARIPSFAIESATPTSRTPATRSWLGITLRNIVGPDEVSAHGLPGETGVLVLNSPTDGPLKNSGLKKDDVILQIDNRTIDSISDLPANPPTLIRVWRDQSNVALNLQPPSQSPLNSPSPLRTSP